MAALLIIYYLIALYSSWRFFRRPRIPCTITPPVSILKPIRGMDPENYENFASLCRQDYPEYEILFCVNKPDDPVLPVIEQIVRDFSERRIRILFGMGNTASNDKVAKLGRLVSEAQSKILVMGDSDVPVEPDYLRAVVAPFANPEIGAVTCLYMPVDNQTIAGNLRSIGMVSDFYAGLLVA